MLADVRCPLMVSWKSPIVAFSKAQASLLYIEGSIYVEVPVQYEESKSCPLAGLSLSF